MHSAGKSNSSVLLLVYNKGMKLRSMLAALLLLGGCAAPASHEKKTLWVLTDTHYLSPKLFRPEAAAFQKLLESNDGKMIEAMPGLLQEFREDALAEHPDAVLVSGDLTLNGEYISLLELKEMFGQIEEAGIPVLVIPGNHDIRYPAACDLSGDVPIITENFSQQTFASEMGNFGYYDSLSHASDSFSYVYALDDDLWIIALDGNTEAQPGSITADTLIWAEEQLQYASSHGINVITMTHQNVLKQSELLFQGYILNNAQAVESVLKHNDVFLNLSGHSHLQHTSISDTLTDICTEASSIWPLGYAEVKLEEDHRTYTYEMKRFTSFQDEAKERFDVKFSGRSETILKDLDIPDDIRERMTTFAADLNRAYFSGTLENAGEYKYSEEWQFWKQYAGDSLWYLYMQMIFKEYEN